MNQPISPPPKKTATQVPAKVIILVAEELLGPWNDQTENELHRKDAEENKLHNLAGSDFGARRFGDHKQRGAVVKVPGFYPGTKKYKESVKTTGADESSTL